MFCFNQKAQNSIKKEEEVANIQENVPSLQVNVTRKFQAPFNCEMCEWGFWSHSSLRNHMLCHTGEKKFKCELCEKAFSRKASYLLHLQIHTGEQPFTCEQCGMSFNVKGNLTRHIRTHTGEKPYLCEYCGSAFSQSNSLKDHMRRHTGEGSRQQRREKKICKCDFCDKTYTHPTPLFNHVRSVHTGERPFACDLCKWTFTRKAFLDSHRLTHFRKNSKPRRLKPSSCSSYSSRASEDSCSEAEAKPKPLTMRLRDRSQIRSRLQRQEEFEWENIRSQESANILPCEDQPVANTDTEEK